MLDQKCFGGSISMKIDIHKCFDTLSRKFLVAALTAFGFSSNLFL